MQEKKPLLKETAKEGWHILVSDVEKEGKKRGYEKAAKEYQKAFDEIEQEYIKTEKLIKMQKKFFCVSSEMLIRRQEELERKREELEIQVMKKMGNVSVKFHISQSKIFSSFGPGVIVTGAALISILGLIYKHKEKRLLEAEACGYMEAKRFYEEKIAAEKKRLEELKKKMGKDTANALNLIIDLLDEIAKEQMKIAELNALL